MRKPHSFHKSKAEILIYVNSITFAHICCANHTVKSHDEIQRQRVHEWNGKKGTNGRFVNCDCVQSEGDKFEQVTRHIAQWTWGR